MAGNTWRALTKGLPSSDDGGLGRIGVAVAPTQPHRVYATVKQKRERESTARTTPENPGAWLIAIAASAGAGPGAMGIAVAPDNPDVIYVANTTTWKSSDAGKTFVGFRGAPGGDDYQRIWISSEASANDCAFQ